MNLKNNWALITGASAGIGAATAMALGNLGVNLILVARRSERLLELQKKLAGKCEVKPLELDVCDFAQVEKVLNQTPEVQNTRILINNAGLARGADKIQDGDFAGWQTMIETNVLGLLAVTKAVLPTLLKAEEAHIVNIGSVAGRWVYPGGNVYCASKFAVSALSEGMRMDLLGKPVRVTNIEPGMVETEFSMVRFEDAKKAKAVYEGIKPLTAEDVAESIVWCLNRPSHVNVAELVLYPRDQASVRDVHRK